MMITMTRLMMATMLQIYAASSHRVENVMFAEASIVFIGK